MTFVYHDLDKLLHGVCVAEHIICCAKLDVSQDVAYLLDKKAYLTVSKCLISRTPKGPREHLEIRAARKNKSVQKTHLHKYFSDLGGRVQIWNVMFAQHSWL